MAIEPREHPHRQSLQDDDLSQRLYERARIDRERILVSSSRSSRYGSRRGTALHHAHFSDRAFGTIARSLAEGAEHAEKLRGELGDAWIWIAFATVHKAVLVSVIGKRTLPPAVSLLEEVKRVTACMPALLSSDQLKQRENALLRVHGKLVCPHASQGPADCHTPGSSPLRSTRSPAWSR